MSLLIFGSFEKIGSSHNQGIMMQHVNLGADGRGMMFVEGGAAQDVVEEMTERLSDILGDSTEKALQLLKSDLESGKNQLTPFLQKEIGVKEATLIDSPLLLLLQLIVENGPAVKRTNAANHYHAFCSKDQNFNMSYAYLKTPHMLLAHMMIVSGKWEGVTYREQIDKMAFPDSWKSQMDVAQKGNNIGVICRLVEERLDELFIGGEERRKFLEGQYKKIEKSSDELKEKLQLDASEKTAVILMRPEHMRKRACITAVFDRAKVVEHELEPSPKLELRFADIWLREKVKNVQHIFSCVENYASRDLFEYSRSNLYQERRVVLCDVVPCTFEELETEHNQFEEERLSKSEKTSYIYASVMGAYPNRRAGYIDYAMKNEGVDYVLYGKVEGDYVQIATVKRGVLTVDESHQTLYDRLTTIPQR